MVLVDAFWLMYRSRYALDFLHNNEGRPTGMEYGFLKCCEALVRDVHPRLVLCWEGGSWRKNVDENYKANRSGGIEHDRITDFKQFVNRIYPHAEKAGLEADDVMASLADHCYIFTNDKDMLQLVNDHVLVIKSHKDKKFPWDEERVMEKYFGLEPKQLPQYFAFVGDEVDNVPGCSVRRSVVADVIKSSSTMKDILLNPRWSDIEQTNIWEWIQSGRYQKNLELVTLRKENVEIEEPLWDKEAIEKWLRMMELRSLQISGKVGIWDEDEF